MAELFKTNQGLFETSGEELAKQGTTSPAGAAGQGASPDQSKMMGTPAQKQNVVKQQPRQPTYQEMQRYRPKQAPEPAAAQAAQEKVQRLKNLGGIETQLEGLIQQKLQQAQEQKIQQQAVNDQYIQQTIDTHQQEGLQAALKAYASITPPPEGATLEQQAVYDEQKQQALINVMNASGGSITAKNINDYFVGAEGQLGQMLEGVTPETMAIGDVWNDQLGDMEQVAADLGIDSAALQNMTMPEFENLIQQVEAQEYNRIQNIRAELGTATGARREQLIRELEGLTQQGVTGVEAQYDRIQRDIEEARTIDIAGEEFTLSKILEDDGLSQYILSSLTDENIRKQIEDATRNPETGESGLIAWIDENKDLLSQIQESTQADVTEFEGIQSEAKELTSANEPLAEALFWEDGERPEYMTEAELNAKKEEMKDSGVWQAATSDPEVNALFQGEEGIALAQELKNYPADTIVALKDLNKDVRNEPTLRAWLGLEEGAFPTDPAVLEQYEAIKEGMNALRDADSEIFGRLQNYPNSLTGSQLLALSRNTAKWPSIQKSLDFAKQLEDGTNIDEITNMMFGGMNSQEVNAKLNRLKVYADMGDEKSLQAYIRLRQLVGSDNKLDASDMARMKGKLEEITDIDSILSGGADVNAFTGANTDTLNREAYLSNTPKGELAALLMDGRLTINELSNISPENLSILANDPELKGQYKQILKDEISRRERSTPEAIAAQQVKDLDKYTKLKGIFKAEGADLKIAIENKEWQTLAEQAMTGLSAGDQYTAYKKIREEWQAQEKKINEAITAMKKLKRNAKGDARNRYKELLNQLEDYRKQLINTAPDIHAARRNLK